MSLFNFKKIKDNIYDESISFGNRLTRMALVVIIFVVAVATIACVLGGQSVWVFVVNCFIEVLLLWTLIITVKRGKSGFATILLFLVMFGVSLPVIFFTGGGMYSASSLWYVLAFTMIFILLDGIKAPIILVYGLVSYFACVIVSYKYPELVTELSDRKDMYIDMAFSTSIVAFCIGAAISIQSIEYKREQKNAEERKRIAEEASKSKDSFFANMSHEIRTPINTIIGLNEIILRQSNDDSITENALTIQNASNTLLTLINDIMDMSKIETGKMEIIPVEYDTARLFSDLLSTSWIRAEEKKLQLRLDVAKDIPSVLYGDEVRIKQVLMNFMSNALKYTKEGEVALTARCESIGKDLVNLRVSISDTGIGLRKEELDVLFDSFAEDEDGKVTKIEGYGLGLSICKNLADLMHGRISVDSVYTKGSTFTLNLMQRVVDPKPIGEKVFKIKKYNKNYGGYRQSFEASKARVLVVDDNALNLQVTVKLLSGTKVQVDAASSGEEALILTADNAYDVILMDHLMPEMDGVETMRAIKKQIGGQSCDTPVVALTANSGENAEETYRMLGFAAYISKPIQPLQLETVVKRFLPAEIIEYSVDMEEDSVLLRSSKNSSADQERKTLIVSADCTCDIPVDILERCGIPCMYYNVYIDGKRFQDTVEITASNLSNIINKGNEIISLPADVPQYEKFFADLLTEADEVLHFTIGKETGIAYSVACDAARCFGNVHIIDSGSITGGMGLIAMTVAEEVAKGTSITNIMKYIDEIKQKENTSFMLSRVDDMYRTRKIGGVVYGISKIMKLKPVLVMKDSAIKVGGVKFGSFNFAVKNYIRKLFKNSAAINPRILVINYVGVGVKEREMIKREVSRYIFFENIIEQPASTTIAIYCGEGVISFSYFTK